MPLLWRRLSRATEARWPRIVVRGNTPQKQSGFAAVAGDQEVVHGVFVVSARDDVSSTAQVEPVASAMHKLTNGGFAALQDCGHLGIGQLEDHLEQERGLLQR